MEGNGGKESPQSPQSRTSTFGVGLELHTYVMTRLTRWTIYCLWRADLLTAKPGPRDVKSWWFTMVMSPNVQIQHTPITRRIPCPVDEVECGVTELCIQQLSEQLRDVVVIGSLSSETAEAKALELGCDRRTYFRRMNRACAELLGLFNDHEAGVDRVDVEAATAELGARNALAPAPALPVVQGERRSAATRGVVRTA